MRFGEYRDALTLVGRYPVFGVGFTGTPDIDIYLGVSMLYLIIAENMGIVGLLAFLAVVVGYLVMATVSWRRGCEVDLEPLLLGYTGAVLGALASGIFDHYWFNMTYPHMTVLFWLYLGLGAATSLIQETRRDSSRAALQEGIP
jgi:O-antigen ligase